MLDAVAAKHTMNENSDGVVLHGRWSSRGLLEYVEDEYLDNYQTPGKKYRDRIGLFEALGIRNDGMLIGDDN